MTNMRSLMAGALATVCLTAGLPWARAAGIEQREVHFYSEGVLCYGKLYLPSGYSDSAKVPAVVLAPGSGKTSTSLDAYAADLAAHGILAMTFDYRGWGRSGGFLYFGEPVEWDDRLRFSQTTTLMRIRRKRLEPQLQLTDIRNALTYIEGEQGVDRARLGVFGTDLSGGHAVVVAGIDARVKVVVAQLPMLVGRDTPRNAFAPDARQQAQMVKLARSGAAPASAREAGARNAQESALALTEYHPYW
jgi:dienelactone hydrolase